MPRCTGSGKNKGKDPDYADPDYADPEASSATMVDAELDWAKLPIMLDKYFVNAECSTAPRAWTSWKSIWGQGTQAKANSSRKES